MSKKKKAKSREPVRQNSPAKSAKSGKARESITRRSVIKSVALAGVVLAVGAGIHVADASKKEQHDLSVIGAGRPVVVQVHDPSCPSCRQLMRSTKSALKKTTQLDYRIADLTTQDGQALASKYGVGKVTLLLFDGRGKHVHTVAGVQSVENLTATFERQFSL